MMKRLLGRLAVLGVTFTLCFVVLELAAAVHHYRQAGVNPYSRATLKEAKKALRDAVAAMEAGHYRHPSLALHPYLGYIANFDHHQTHKGMPNSESGFFSDVDAVYRRSESNEFVVVVLGGSVAAQLCILGGDTLREELGKLPAAEGRPVVINALCQGGYKQPQQMIAFAYHHALGLQADLVINLDGVNEMLFFQNNILNNKIDPSYPWNWLALVTTAQRHPDIMRAQLSIMDEREARARRAKAWLESRVYKTALGRMVRRHLDLQSVNAERQAEQRLMDALAELDKEELTFPQTGPVYWQTEDFYRAMEQSARLWRRAGILLSDMIRERGIPYVHGLQPNQYFPGTRTLTEWEQSNAYNTNSTFYRPLSVGYAYFTNEIPRLQAAGVPIVNMSDYLGDPAETIYSDDFSHFNPRGNELLAEAVVRAVAEMMAGQRRIGTIRQPSLSVNSRTLKTHTTASLPSQ